MGFPVSRDTLRGFPMIRTKVLWVYIWVPFFRATTKYVKEEGARANGKAASSHSYARIVREQSW